MMTETSPMKSAAVLLALAGVAACADPPLSAGLGAGAAPFFSAIPSSRPTIDDLFELTNGQVQGFAGVYLTEDGVPVVRLTDPTRLADAKRAITRIFGSLPGANPAAARAIKAQYDFRTLRKWQIVFHRSASFDGIVRTDIDEVANRFYVGVESQSVKDRVLDDLRRLGVPDSGAVVEIVTRTVPTASLTDPSAPRVGGLYITVNNATGGSHACTLGFNVTVATDPTGLYAVTNSHCTTIMGSVSQDVLWQPIPAFPYNVAVEVADPPWVAMPSDPGCPTYDPNIRCRYSDAALFKYHSPSLGSHGAIARTLHYTSLSQPTTLTRDTVDFHVTSELPASWMVVNTLVQKVGATTGWTTARITRTCSTEPSFDSSLHKFVCQFNAADNMSIGSSLAGNGDSGSPVFLSMWLEDPHETRTLLAGILHAFGIENGTYVMVFSPMDRIFQELGNLKTYPGPTCVPDPTLTMCQ